MSADSKFPKVRPFPAAPDPRRYFPAAAIEEARRRVTRALARGEGPSLVCGGPGVGKSMLMAVLAEQFSGQENVVALIAGGQLCTRRALLQTILFHLDHPFQGLDEGELRLAILDILRGRTTAGDTTRASATRLLLLVDEAEALPHRLYGELRGLTNIAIDGQPLVSLVFAGGPQLEELFTEPQMNAFSQRLAARCYLSPLSRDETVQYVRSQIAAADGDPDALLSSAALAALFTATDGIPRLINQLADRLICELSDLDAPLGAEHVQRAWADLQQLPEPWEPRPAAVDAAQAAAGVVEFGELNAGDDELPASIPFAGAAPKRNAEPDVEADTELNTAAALPESLLEVEEIPTSVESAVALDSATAALDSSRVEDPFDEPFDDEEFVLDQYATFDAELWAGATAVVNALDAAFALDLGRAARDDEPGHSLPTYTVHPPHDGVDPPVILEQNGFVAQEYAAADRDETGGEEVDVVRAADDHEGPTSVALPDPESVDRGEVLVVDEDDRPGPEVVPSRHFRRLFSQLESAQAP